MMRPPWEDTLNCCRRSRNTQQPTKHGIQHTVFFGSIHIIRLFVSTLIAVSYFAKMASVESVVLVVVATGRL